MDKLNTERKIGKKEVNALEKIVGISHNVTLYQDGYSVYIIKQKGPKYTILAQWEARVPRK